MNLSEEQKQEAAKEAVGKSQRQIEKIGKRLGVSAGTVYLWRRKLLGRDTPEVRAAKHGGHSPGDGVPLAYGNGRASKEAQPNGRHVEAGAFDLISTIEGIEESLSGFSVTDKLRIVDFVRGRIALARKTK